MVQIVSKASLVRFQLHPGAVGHIIRFCCMEFLLVLRIWIRWIPYAIPEVLYLLYFSPDFCGCKMKLCVFPIVLHIVVE